MPHSSIFEAGRINDIFVTQKGRDKITAALEEERRLVYVAITRAKDELIVSSPAYYRGKKKAVSRFILAAFPKQIASNAGTQPQHSATISKASSVNTKQTETVYAWICTSETCNAWQRIRTFEEAELPSKVCPLCKSMMEKGSKEVIVN